MGVAKTVSPRPHRMSQNDYYHLLVRACEFTDTQVFYEAAIGTRLDDVIDSTTAH